MMRSHHLHAPIATRLVLLVSAALVSCSGDSGSAPADLSGTDMMEARSEDLVPEDLPQLDAPASFALCTGADFWGRTLNLGDSLQTVTARFGPPPVLRDLGAAGTLFEYPAAGVGGMLVPPATTDPDAAPATDPATDAAATVAAIYLYESFSGTTADGLETDSPLSEWTAALGDGVPDPFLPAVHLPTEGLVLGLDGDTVSAITLGAGACAPGPRPDTVSCPPSPPFGCALGDVMEDMTFADAGGATLSLHGLCGSAMTLLYHYYGWCATCGTFASGLADLMADYGPKGLGLVFVVAEDPLSRAATSDYCQQVKEQYGLPGFVACDPDHLLEACGANGLLVLLDSSLNVVFKQEGPSVEAVRKALDKGLE